MTRRMLKRMDKELRGLQAKINKLEVFMDSDLYRDLGEPEKLFLKKQYGAMLVYENYLAKRIDMY